MWPEKEMRNMGQGVSVSVRVGASVRVGVSVLTRQE